MQVMIEKIKDIVEFMLLMFGVVFFGAMITFVMIGSNN